MLKCHRCVFGFFFAPFSASSWVQFPSKTRSRIRAGSAQRQAARPSASARSRPPSRAGTSVCAGSGTARAPCGRRLFGRPRKARSTSGGPTQLLPELAVPAEVCAEDDQARTFVKYLVRLKAYKAPHPLRAAGGACCPLRCSRPSPARRWGALGCTRCNQKPATARR